MWGSHGHHVWQSGSGEVVQVMSASCVCCRAGSEQQSVHGYWQARATISQVTDVSWASDRLVSGRECRGRCLGDACVSLC